MENVLLKDVRKIFKDFVAVNNVNIDIQPGEFFTFLGPSGCGKTTTLRMIAGFSFPTQGEIYFGDRNVTYLDPNKRNIGMVFQNYALFPHMTVAENVAFGLKIRKFSKKEIDFKVENALEKVNLPGLGKRKINELSGGQQQRVALARALVIEPEILLLDEPLSNLDAKLREETRKEIKKLQLDMGITTIYVTHDQGEAMAVSDRIMIMKKGEIQQIGTPLEIYNTPNNSFVASFIGENNIIEGTLAELEGKDVKIKISENNSLIGNIDNKGENLNLKVGDKVKFCVRPEGIKDGTEKDYGFNVLTGKVQLTEYTGMNIQYMAQFEGDLWKIIFISTGHSIINRGEEIKIHVPKDNIFFVEKVH
ncbi:ABC transporter ATP-binding protein [Clostridium sp. MSJ-11]|uniref:ABC transporter ATP-binding protein n=1 Tax=Clostridium mobile TaxID=2841512 RepID=A0ABS6EDV5_9CLOT|nr:ABC transporter ATP-binding protein [Clostridium mobile]MBU5483374.1 ABC transporter ATP-binding protein [Clostridium mobile]